jgi:diguanylate cyclase (GGDEF)-like protein
LLAAASAGPTGFVAGLAATRCRVRRAVDEAAHAQWLADHDALTGLPNRHAARRRYQHAAQTGRPCAVALVDLDDFKTVNDTWGHQAGDAHLVAIGERLASSCREVGAVACRLGGDEFVLLLESADAGEAVRQVTEIVAALRAELPLVVDETRTVSMHPRASAGIALAAPDDTFSDTLRHADIALYHAKRHRTAPCLYTAELQHPSSHRHKAEGLTLHPQMEMSGYGMGTWGGTFSRWKPSAL